MSKLCMTVSLICVQGISIVDCNATKGTATAEEFNKKYGPDKACFIQCDVSIKEQLEGIFLLQFAGCNQCVNDTFTSL